MLESGSQWMLAKWPVAPVIMRALHAPRVVRSGLKQPGAPWGYWASGTGRLQIRRSFSARSPWCILHPQLPARSPEADRTMSATRDVGHWTLPGKLHGGRLTYVSMVRRLWVSPVPGEQGYPAHPTSRSWVWPVTSAGTVGRQTPCRFRLWS